MNNCGAASCKKYRSSPKVYAGFNGKYTAPARTAAKYTNSASGDFGTCAATLSPGRTPKETNKWASCAVRSSISP